MERRNLSWSQCFGLGVWVIVSTTEMEITLHSSQFEEEYGEFILGCIGHLM